jgi:hypothetical protein
MEKQISTGLKVTFLVHFILGVIIGLLYLLVPEWWSNLSGWPTKDVTAERLIGAAFLGFTASSWWAYREAIVEKVKIVVKMEIVWTILASLVILWGLLFEGAPSAGWMNFIVMAAFAVAFIVFYPRE